MTVKTVTLEGQNTKFFLHILITAIMAGLSIYLTSHYFDLHYPTGLTGKSICNLSSFFSCDSASFSSLSNLFTVPISMLGLIFSLILLVSSFFSNRNIEGTNHILIMVNFAGCLYLFFHSIFILKTLCPVCALYYIASGFLFFLYFKGSSIRTLSIKVLVIYGTIMGLGFGSTLYYIDGKEQINATLKQGLLSQYDKLPNQGVPSHESPFKIAQSTENFTDAPLQLSIFSDFECPACKALSEVLSKVVARYKGKINIQYFFYPLDNACNPQMTRAGHINACHAAHLASCFQNDFYKVHDEIFEAQEVLSPSWINAYAKKHGKEACINSEETRNQVLKSIDMGIQVGVRSTPTMLVNGVKIEGVLPPNQLFIILDELLDRHGKK